MSEALPFLWCGDVQCTDKAGTHSAESRKTWKMENHGLTEEEATIFVMQEFPDTCAISLAKKAGLQLVQTMVIEGIKYQLFES